VTDPAGDGGLLDIVAGSGSFVLVFAVFLAIAVAEMRWAQRPGSALTPHRWAGNLSLFGAGMALSAMPFVAAYSAALATGAAEFGLLNHLGLPGWLRFLLAILILDLVAYALHRIMHAVPILWRLHAVHHSDPEIDVTTTLRSHPLGMIPGALFGTVSVLAAGYSPEEIAVYGMLVQIVQLVAHANLRLPARAEAIVGRVLVTPRFHEVHHSPRQAETDSHYGELFAFWDRLFGTATEPLPRERGAPQFGLDLFREAGAQLPHRVLAQPFLMRSPAPRLAE
jgi:sterol desaturase/sphingolipid hydroxylase (fatty acid hydroxylase superfamily)